MGKKGEVVFERRVMSQKAMEGITEDCLRVEANTGNPDIVDLTITEIVARYEYSTERDRYGTHAAIVRDTDSEEKPEPKNVPPLPQPKFIDRDDAARDFIDEPNDVFGEIDNNDGAYYGDDFPQEDRMEMVRATRRLSEYLKDDGLFNGR